jgi:hypothetical protein
MDQKKAFYPDIQFHLVADKKKIYESLFECATIAMICIKKVLPSEKKQTEEFLNGEELVLTFSPSAEPDHLPTKYCDAIVKSCDAVHRERHAMSDVRGRLSALDGEVEKAVEGVEKLGERLQERTEEAMESRRETSRESKVACLRALLTSNDSGIGVDSSNPLDDAVALAGIDH